MNFQGNFLCYVYDYVETHKNKSESVAYYHKVVRIMCLFGDKRI